MAKVKVKSSNAAQAKAEEELTQALALAEKMGIEITEDDDLESIQEKLKEKGIEKTSGKDEVSEEEAEGLNPEPTESVGGRPAGVPKTARQVKANAEDVIMYQKKGKLVGHDEKKGTAWVIPAILLAFSFLFGGNAIAADSTDEGVLGNNRWSVQNDGDFVPNANTYSIGSATQYPASIWVNGQQYSSFAAGTDGNWTDTGLTTTLNGAPSKFIATYSSGDFASTSLTPSGLTASRAVVSNGSKTLASSATTSTELGYLSGVTTPTGTGALVLATTPTLVTPVIGAATGTSLVLSGAATSAGVTTSAAVTLSNGETIANATNGTVTVTTNTSAPILDVRDAGTSDTDATLSLSADAAADSGDVWRLTSDGTTNSLFFENNLSGAQLTVCTLANTGIITTTNDIEIDGTTPRLVIGNVVGVGSPIVFEDATADAFETTLAVADATADITITIPATAVSAGVMLTSLTTNQVDAANSVTGTSNGFIAEGATADGFEDTISFTDPTADQTITFPNMAAAYAIMPNTLTTNSIDAANSVWFASNSSVWEGATADAFETTVSPVDPTADQTVSIANAGVNNSLMFNTLTTNTIDAANSVWFASSAQVWEGTTADGFETTISPIDPTADQTVSIPNFAVNWAIMGSTLTTNKIDAANSLWGVSNGLVMEGATADAFELTVAPADVTADRTATLPDQTGTVFLAGAATVLTPGAAITLTVAPGNRTYTLTQTDNTDGTITFSGAGAAGDRSTIVFTTTGAADEIITFHATLASSVGTLTLGTTASHYMTAVFESDGSKWHEISRTADQT